MMRPTWNRLPAPVLEPDSILRFAPLAWLKLQFFCHAGHTEIGGFGISALGDPLYVEDFVTVRQQVTPLTVRFADDAVSDFFDHCVDAGLKPQRFARIWCHTHPGDSVVPSSRDEETFSNSFGCCDWALMFILGRTGQTYARLAFSAGPGGALLLPTAADWAAWPEWVSAGKGRLEAQVAQWQQEYMENIHLLPALTASPALAERLEDTAEDWWETYPYHSELDEVTYGLAETDYPLAAADRTPPF
jgi:hypothetical protein